MCVRTRVCVCVCDCACACACVRMCLLFPHIKYKIQTWILRTGVLVRMVALCLFKFNSCRVRGYIQLQGAVIWIILGDNQGVWSDRTTLGCTPSHGLLGTSSSPLHWHDALLVTPIQVVSSSVWSYWFPRSLGRQI